MTAAIDNDVLIKGACFGLLPALIWPKVGEQVHAGILGAARFVVPKQIARKAPLRGVDSALSEFVTFLENAQLLEPTPDEQALAAELELSAQRRGLNLDAGESQLCAMVVVRSFDRLMTGDKRAVRAMQSLFETDTRLAQILQRVKCLEQLMVDLITSGGCLAALRASVCGEPHIDKVLTICFACNSPNCSGSEAVDGLLSYIGDLRNDARDVLAE